VSNHLILPRLLNRQSWDQPSTCKVSPVGNDEEDKAKPAIDALTARLAKITNLATCSVAPPATVATIPGDLDKLDLNSIAASSPLIPRILGASTAELVPKDMPPNKKLHNHVKLAYLGWDCTAESLDLPAPTENDKWLYCSTDWVGINKAMVSMCTNIPKALSQSAYFLHREVNLPPHDPLVYAQYMTSYYEVASMQSIELTVESKKRFCYF
jgi:hypothetical protein